MNPQVGAIGKVVSSLEHILAVGLVGVHFFLSYLLGDLVNNDVITVTDPV